jgi:hypothetical protein
MDDDLDFKGLTGDQVSSDLQCQALQDSKKGSSGQSLGIMSPSGMTDY